VTIAAISSPKRAVCLVAFIFLGTGLARGQSAANALPDGDAKPVVATTCTQCHTLKLISVYRNGTVGWKEMVDNMMMRGAQVRPAEVQPVLDYLVKNFGPAAGPMQSPSGTDLTLPDAPGKAVVISHCGFCHDAGKITSARRSKSEWEYTVTRMVHWSGLATSPEDIQAMTSYLASQFGRPE
jgi:cytochrome c5